MVQEQPNNPLHGLTLETIVKSLFETYGWEDLGDKIDIRCFKNDPSVKSSLKFLRKTPWARTKVERLYLKTEKKKQRKARKEKKESIPASAETLPEVPAEPSPPVIEGKVHEVVKPAVVKPAVVKPAVVKPAVVEPAVVKPAVVKPKLRPDSPWNNLKK
jgi:uncharacterized protein (DUF2132 family)